MARTTSRSNSCIAFSHRPPPVGGPGSFQTRLELGLREAGWTVVYAPSDAFADVILVVGGTRRLWWLMRARLRGTRIVHRLDGIDWQHRVRWPGLRRWIRAEVRNLLVRVIRRFYADVRVYQSEFVTRWWTKRYGSCQTPTSVIHNGVDLDAFCPRNRGYGTPQEEVICVEGRISDVGAADVLAAVRRWPVRVYGEVSSEVRRRLVEKGAENVQLMGTIPRSAVPDVLAGRRVFLSLDVNAACPNSVIEAMAAGLPVVGFDTGSLRELAGGEGSELLPHTTNPWQLQAPVTNGLEVAIAGIFANYEKRSLAARRHAEARFDVALMVRRYLQVINTAIARRGVSEPATPPKVPGT